MKLFMLMHFNKKINCFSQPIFIDIEPEKVAIQEARTLKVSDIDKIIPYKNLDLYYIGDFDDETGDIIPLKKKKFLLDAGEIVEARLEEKGVKDVESKPIIRE